jgi:hypothetical protein
MPHHEQNQTPRSAFMSNQKFIIPFFLLAALLLLLIGVSCGHHQPAAPKNANPVVPATPATNASSLAQRAASIPDAEIATSTPAATNQPVQLQPTGPAGDNSRASGGGSKPQLKQIEMPETAPTAPKNFYPAEVAKQTNYFLRFRTGYEHINCSDNNDAVYFGAKFRAHGDALRARAGKNAWLVPDADLEFARHLIAKPNTDAHPGTGEGISLRSTLFLPWFNWTMQNLSRSNAVCPLCRPLALGLGPVGHAGFDKLDDGETRFVGYVGARLSINRDAFIEYTFGQTDGLSGNREELAAELPLYTSRDGNVRYLLRGSWNHAAGVEPDILNGSVLVEMPFDFLVKPNEWRELLPFVK